MLTLVQIDAVLDRLYKKENHTETDKEQIKYYEQIYEDIVAQEDKR